MFGQAVPDGLSFSATQPQAKAVLDDHLHPIGVVDEQVRMIRSRVAKHIHDPSQRFIGTGTHVERLNGEPGHIDTDHFIISRSESAFMRRRCWPVDIYRAPSAFDLDADRACRSGRGQRRP